jgi:hypothetical protein
MDQGWSDWDLQVHGGIWSRAPITMCTEYHGGERRVLRVKCAFRGSLLTRFVAFAALAVVALGIELARPAVMLTGVAAAVIGAVAFGRERLSLGRMLHGTLQTVARHARLHYAPPLRDDDAAPPVPGTDEP